VYVLKYPEKIHSAMLLDEKKVMANVH